MYRFILEQVGLRRSESISLLHYMYIFYAITLRNFVVPTLSLVGDPLSGNGCGSPNHIYEGCPESIQPFWISREPVAWPWCNLAASQRRPYCASVNSHSPVGLVIRQWDAVDWTCVMCDRRIHNDRASRSASSR